MTRGCKEEMHSSYKTVAQLVISKPEGTGWNLGEVTRPGFSFSCYA